jgi:hypothetical protein
MSFVHVKVVFMLLKDLYNTLRDTPNNDRTHISE